MTESIMIEIDEMTESILSTIENRIFDGNQQALSIVKNELEQVLETQRKDLRLLAGNITKIKNQNDDFSEDVMNELNKFHQLIQEELIAIFHKFVEGFGEQQAKLISQLKEQLDQIQTQMTDNIINQVAPIQEQVAALANEQKVTTENLESIIKQELHSLNEELQKKVTQQETNHKQVIDLLTKSNEKMEALEAELRWHNQPFYKKWFRKREVK